MKTRKEVEELWNTLALWIIDPPDLDKGIIAKEKFIAFFCGEDDGVTAEDVAGFGVCVTCGHPVEADDKRWLIDKLLYPRADMLGRTVPPPDHPYPTEHQGEVASSVSLSHPRESSLNQPAPTGRPDPYAHLKQAQAEGKVICLRQNMTELPLEVRLENFPVDALCIKPEDPKLVSFEEALKWYKEGGDFRSESWKDSFRRKVLTRGLGEVYLMAYEILQDRWLLLPKEGE